MNFIQYKELLKLRGITEIEKGKTVGSTVEESGGEPTPAEMVEVNRMSLKYYIDKYKEEKEWREKLETRVALLEEDSNWLSCLEATGVDNWEGYGIAQDLFNEEKTND